MTGLILVRHGETEWNVTEVFRGRIDVGLNETGVRQAKLLAGYLGDIKIEAIYSSPLQRALKTAEIIARCHKLPVNIAQGLTDLNFGLWQGLARQEVENKYKELYPVWTHHPEKVQMPDGESLSDVRRRALDTVTLVITRHKGSVVLVSHRVVHKILICALLGLDNSHFWQIKLDTCGITSFSYENGRFVLTKHNDTSFLKPLEKATLSDF